ncbi:DinB family protein [Flavivirga spongiicola]|uniref:DinB family protein n=1 Tax=Flavivirga spongiicola TaxID=421621 RepID=A0ABU7XU08_9FLAO|nr:DinB family protein [Flavivirga sp. MEBiC05379]MDO5979270.1 DinB family protein [Flavivirga sp. MEBiC05379]
MTYNLKQALEILERTPNTLNAWLTNLSDEWIYTNEGDNTWSVFDVVGHLIHGEKTDWMIRTRIILSDSENKTFESFDRFAQFENSKGKTLQQLLKEFSELRVENLKALKQLEIKESQFGMKATHPELGEVTLKELLATWVTHDLGHIAQITRVMAKLYKDEVGPWEAFIPILNK